MGVFVYSNSRIDASKSEDIFKSRGHENIVTEDINGTFVHSNKVLINNENYLCGKQLEQEDDYVLGIGTYFYNNLFGKAALLAIYKDIDNVLEDNLIYGHYAFVVHKNDKTYIFNDMSGTLSLYYAQTGNNIIISSSLLSVVASIDNPTIDKVRLSAFLAGNHGNELPFVEGIEFVNPLRYIVIPDNEKPQWFERKEIPVKRIETLEEAITYVNGLFKEQMNQLKAIGSEKISIELTAGLDSRLIASNLKTGGFNYDFVNYPLFGPDSEIANLIARGLKKKVHVINNSPCVDKFEDKYGEFDYGFNYFRQYPNKRWNIETRFQFSGARGECLDLPDIYADEDVSMMKNPRPDVLLPVLTVTNIMKREYSELYQQYIINYMKKYGFEPNKDMTEKEQVQFTQILCGQLTGDYMYNSAANAHLYFYQIYNEYHFNHFIIDIKFDTKSCRKLTLALISSIDSELGSFPFVSRRRTKRSSVNETKELPIQYKSYNKIKQLLPKSIVNFIYGRMGRKFDKSRLKDIDLELYKDIIEIKTMVNYPNLYSQNLNRLYSLEVLRKKLNIAMEV